MQGKLDHCLVHPCPTDQTPPRILQLKLTPEALEQLRLSQGKGLSIDFDSQQALIINGVSHKFSTVPEAAAVEFYRRPRRRQSAMELAGKVTHKLTMRRELGSSVTEKLKSRQAEEIAAKQERSIVPVQLNPKNKKGAPNPAIVQRPAHGSAIRADSPARKSTFLQARKSPLLVASSAKTPVITPKARLLQLLASSSASETELLAKLRISQESLTTLLHEVAQRSGDDWGLRDALFKDVKFWDWKHYTSAERVSAISRAGEAFDRLGLSQEDPARFKLVHPDKRGRNDRNDTSPLSLNPPISADTNQKEVPEQAISTRSNQPIEKAPPSRTSTPVTVSNELELPEKRRNGLLSAGKAKRSVAAKPKVDTKTESHSEISVKGKANKRPAAIKAKEKSPATNSADTPATTITTSAPSTIRSNPKVVSKQTSATASDGQRLPSSTNIVIKPRSEDLPIESVNKKVSSVTIPIEAEMKEKSDRTSSLTSSTSSRSVESKSTTSTAPSSIAEVSPPPKVRSKFLTTKKFEINTLSRPVSRSTSPNVLSLVPKQRESSQSPDSSPTNNIKKRKAENGLPDYFPANKLQKDDLNTMAHDYQRLYSEYQRLHDEVAQKFEDKKLFYDFMHLHNRMTKWKQTLFE